MELDGFSFFFEFISISLVREKVNIDKQFGFLQYVAVTDAIFLQGCGSH